MWYDEWLLKSFWADVSYPCFCLVFVASSCSDRLLQRESFGIGIWGTLHRQVLIGMGHGIFSLMPLLDRLGRRQNILVMSCIPRQQRPAVWMSFFQGKLEEQRMLQPILLWGSRWEGFDVPVLGLMVTVRKWHWMLPSFKPGTRTEGFHAAVQEAEEEERKAPGLVMADGGFGLKVWGVKKSGTFLEFCKISQQWWRRGLVESQVFEPLRFRWRDWSSIQPRQARCQKKTCPRWLPLKLYRCWGSRGTKCIKATKQGR